jgi:hypothetical protein
MKRRKKMNIQKLNDCLEALKRDLGEGLIASSIISTTDCQTIAATEKSSPVTATIFGEVTNFIQSSLSKGPYPQLGKFYYMDLVGNKGLIFIPLGDYQWGISIDTKKCKLGLLLNIILPTMITNFEEAVTS